MTGPTGLIFFFFDTQSGTNMILNMELIHFYDEPDPTLLVDKSSEPTWKNGTDFGSSLTNPTRVRQRPQVCGTTTGVHGLGLSFHKRRLVGSFLEHMVKTSNKWVLS